MVRHIQHLNRAFTTLDGAITGSATSIDVVDGSIFPTEGDYNLAVGNEIMRVTARSSNTLTVVRGVEGTGGQEAATGAYVFPLLTAEAMNKWVEDALGNYGVFRSWDQPNRIVDSNGDALDSTDFTQGNWDGSSVTDNTWGGITIFADSEATLELRTLYRTAPATPYTVTAHLQVCAGAGTGAVDTTAMCGIAFRDSVSGEMEVYGIRPENGFNHWNFDSWTQFNASVAKIEGMYFRSDGWLRMTDDGTNLTSYCSVNGVTWVQISQVGRTSFLNNAPDQICFWGHTGPSGVNRPLMLQSWREH